MTRPVQITPTGYTSNPASQTAHPARTAKGEDFAAVLHSTAQAKGISFSNHAQKRLQTRDIHLSEDGIERLSTAVEKAEKRGGRESLVLMDDLAFIVNVRDRLVVTAMDARNRGEGVFTQIDSVVLADPAGTRSVEA